MEKPLVFVWFCVVVYESMLLKPNGRSSLKTPRGGLKQRSRSAEQLGGHRPSTRVSRSSALPESPALAGGRRDGGEQARRGLSGLVGWTGAGLTGRWGRDAQQRDAQRERDALVPRVCGADDRAVLARMWACWGQTRAVEDGEPTPRGSPQARGAARAPTSVRADDGGPEF